MTFDELVEQELAAIPAEFQSYLENVAIVVEEEPPRAVARRLPGLHDAAPRPAGGSSRT